MPANATPTIRSIDAIPLAVTFPAARAYGMARGLTSGRATTMVRMTTSDGVEG